MPSPEEGPADEPAAPDGPAARRPARRRIAAVWAVLCLGGLGATFALGGGGEAVGPTDRRPPPPAVSPTPLPTPTEINCEWVADEIEWTRAEWQRRTNPPGRAIVRDIGYPAECKPVLERRGLL
ncbi:hypothetical protein ABZ714_33100 [Streptomyces sp. NPDC006798]|uniref:hypothetical protein n=1 Tax=Streptomyces sp. NPDC006798 TaxID=3155462 RepID=UPI0033ECFBD1